MKADAIIRRISRMISVTMVTGDPVNAATAIIPANGPEDSV
jgi:hypothetical protein